jgi:hypothetical protein
MTTDTDGFKTHEDLLRALLNDARAELAAAQAERDDARQWVEAYEAAAVATLAECEHKKDAAQARAEAAEQRGAELDALLGRALPILEAANWVDTGGLKAQIRAALAAQSGAENGETK